MKIVRLLAALLLVAAMFTACRSSRHAVSDAQSGASPVYTPSGDDGSESTVTPEIADKDGKTKNKESKKKSGKQSETAPKSNVPSVDAVVAKLNLSLQAGDKNISVNGTYRVKRDDVIQINLTYTMLITVNVGAMELTPDYIMIVDRLHKRYCKVAYGEVPALGQAGIDFAYLQRIFWGEATEGQYRTLQWTYANWTPVADGQFPGQIAFSVEHGPSPYKAIFNLSNIRESSNWDTRTEISSKYTQVSYDTVMKAIMNLAQ